MQNKTPNFAKLASNFYLESLLRMSVILINTYMISKVSVLLMASTSAANMLFMICGTLFSLTSSASSVIIAQALGAAKFKIAKICFHHALSINAAFGLLASVLVSVFAQGFLSLLHTPDSTIEHALEYLHFMSWVIFIDAISWVFSSSMRAHGCAGWLSVNVACMNVLTIFLNACFLYGLFGLPEWGLFGVGLSNLISRISSLLGYFFIYKFVLKLDFKLAYFVKFSFKIFKKIFHIGGFNAAGNLLGSLQYICVFSIISRLGSEYLATQTVYYQICFFIFSAAAALSGANAVICGHYKGALNINPLISQIKKVAILCFFASIFMLVLVYIFRYEITSLLSFTSKMSQIAFDLLIVSFFMEPIRALNLAFKMSFNACADVRFNFLLGAFSNWFVGLTLAFLLSNKFALVGIWIGFMADEYFQFCANLWRFKSRKFLNHKLI